jgi:hypothetical protein
VGDLLRGRVVKGIQPHTTLQIHNTNKCGLFVVIMMSVNFGVIAAQRLKIPYLLVNMSFNS